MPNLVQRQVRDLLNFLKEKKYSTHTIDLVHKSFEFANYHHGDQVRKSGEPYIIHPIATTKILASWDMDENTLIAGMLHDVLEDTYCTEEEMIKTFGKEVTTLVKFVTKVSVYSKNNRKNNLYTNLAEKYSIQVFMSMSYDLRAMIIKIADRYHNMQTIQYVKPEKAKKVAQETLDIYASISGRLGMYKVKTELLDMSFAIIDPEAYKSTKEAIANLIETNKKKWDEILLRLKNILEANNIPARFESRIKGVYSTYKKMQSGYEIKQIHDIYAIRVILNDVYMCYQTLGLTHMNFTYLVNTFKDYISAPKWNLYQSIHTTIAFDEVLSEVQIRTNKMDAFANNGLAAHWKYKEANQNDILLTVNNILLRDFLNSNEKDINSIKDITTGTIFDVLVLNSNKFITVSNGSTLLDVAYKYNVDNFFNILAIYRNGERSHFDTHVESGDTIKINYTENLETIKPSWINSANNDIVKKHILNHTKKYELNKQLTKSQFLANAEFFLEGRIASEEHVLNRLEKEFDIKSINTFLDNLSETNIPTDTIYKVFSENKKIANEAILNIKNQAWKWLAKSSYFTGLENIYFTSFKITTCCTKIPGIDCVAKITRNKAEIHRNDCVQVRNSKAKIVVVEWSDEKLANWPRYFKAALLLKGNWTESIGNTICSVLTKMKVNLVKIDIKKHKETKVHETYLLVYVKNLDHLQKAILELEAKNAISGWRII
ncbi:potassium ABC transporter ATPase [Ureaplasma diversum]|uniref:Penta-phosphate guanosine-3'-pyrophosphohydrolase n=2 Tax=Ureaplasma diversum TaxID=42094 RepID=A0A0C5S252_9BACT|nr:RelA/SpoT family protein [Ureaplasma diversum]AJQ45475.1 potassium ABC transporter ATPase [Ureaplasma diversum]